MKNILYKILSALLLILLTVGCAQIRTESSSSAQVSSSQSKEVEGSGALVYSEKISQRLDEQQEALLMDFMYAYFDSLALLEVKDITPLFTDDARSDALGNIAIWAFETQVRKMQKEDLSLTGYCFELKIIDIKDTGDTASVKATCDSIENFASIPNIDSKNHSRYHTMQMKKEGSEWKLISCAQWNGLYRLLTNSDNGSQPAGEDLNTADNSITLSELIDMAQEDIAFLDTRGAPTGKTASYQYDRNAAVSYSYKYIENRNEVWADMGRYGGNCQNYVSQCLFAGGIPMDCSGSKVWKYYGWEVDNKSNSNGRSSSWSSVTYFADYAASNEGYGLVAEVDAPFYFGSPGDLIDLGYNDDWYHTVIIVDTIKNDEDVVIDYMINSNTADLENYPLGAYTYTAKRLIKIIGWNE